MKYSTLIDNMDKVITLYCAANGDFAAIKTEIKEIRHPAAEAELSTYNTTIIDIEWKGNDICDSTTLVLDERDGSVHILKDMQSGCVDKDADLSDYDWEDLTAFVSEDDVANYDKVIKDKVVNTANEYASSGKYNYSVQACYSGHSVPDEEVKRFEDEAEELISKATFGELDAAYDSCIEFGAEFVTPIMVMREIGCKANSVYESLAINSVNVWDNVRP